MSKINDNKLMPRLRFPDFLNNGEWKTNTLDKIAEFLKGKGISKADVEEKGTLPCIRYGELYTHYKEVIKEIKSFTNLSEDDLVLSEEDDVIIPSSGETKEDIATASCVKIKGVALGGDLNILRSELDGEFLAYYLSHGVKKSISKIAQGDAVVHLYSTQLKKISIKVPPKKEEQQKIASCLFSLDEVITTESEKLNILQNHKRGLLQNLLPIGSETIPKFRFAEFRDSDEWVEDTLLNIASFRRGSFPQPYGLPEWYDENGMPFIQVFDVGEDFRLKPTTKNRISELAAKQSVFISKGTLIITLQGSIGRVAITQYDAYIDRTLLLFEKFYRKIDLTFFAYTIFLLFEIEKQKAPGGIIKTITKEVLSSFVVKMPSIEEQMKIASCLSSLDQLISAQCQKVETLKLHKKGLLQSIFPTINNEA